MRFDQFTVAFLLRRPEAPKLDDRAAAELQDAHMAHLARLHDEGVLLAAGPVSAGPNPNLRGISIYRGPIDEARTRAEQDPTCVAGQLTQEFFTWTVPAGTVTFHSSRFPRSMSEVGSG